MLNGLLAITIILINCFVLFIAPWVVFNAWGLGLIMLMDIIIIRLSNIHWHLIHEAAHNILISKRSSNEFFGKILGALFFGSFSMLRFGHFIHHRTNRISDHTDVYFDEKKPGRLYYYFDILGGFFILYEFFITFLVLIPNKKLLSIADHFIEKTEGVPSQDIYIRARDIINHPKKIRLIRREACLMIFVLALSLASYSQHLGLWFGYFMIRALLASYLNNMPHYGNVIDDVNASDTTYLPRLLARCYLNFNYHKTHHLYPTAPWHVLPKLFKDDGLTYNGSYIKHYLRQLKGPIYFKKIINS